MLEVLADEGCMVRLYGIHSTQDEESLTNNIGQGLKERHVLGIVCFFKARVSRMYPSAVMEPSMESSSMASFKGFRVAFQGEMNLEGSNIKAGVY